MSSPRTNISTGELEREVSISGLFLTLVFCFLLFFPVCPQGKEGFYDNNCQGLLIGEETMKDFTMWEVSLTYETL